MDYMLQIAILICIYMMLSASLNLVAGYAGLLSLAHAAFFGIGAYVAAYLALNLNVPFIVGITVAAVGSAAAGTVVGIPSLRIRGDYFAIGTFALQILAFDVFNNWTVVTGGPMGLPGIPPPSILGHVIATQSEFLLLALASTILTYWIMGRIVRSPFGRVLKAIREDERFAQSAGKNVFLFKVTVLAVGAAIAGFAGALYSYHMSYIDPTSFTVMESIFIISIVVVGGSGSLWGPVVGSIVLVLLPEALRFVGIPSAIEANVRQMLYGLLLLAFVVWRPSGVLGSYGFQNLMVRK
jgi:branched-chain amino acid transport system permease protein